MSLKRIIIAFSTLLTFTTLLPLTTLEILRILGLTLDQEVGVYFTVSGTVPLIILSGNATYLFTGFIISGLTLSAYLLINPRLKEVEKLRNQLGDLMSVFRSHAMAGVPIIDSLKKTAELVGPPASKYLETYAHLVSIGEDPLRAETIVTHGLPKEVRLVFASITQAMKSGGRYLEVLSQGEEYLRQLTRLNDVRKSRLSEYKLILALSVVAYVFASIVTLKLVTSMGAGIKGMSILTTPTDIGMLKSAYYISALTLTGITSIIMSKAIEGYVAKSLKYVAVFTLIITAMFVGSELI